MTNADNSYWVYTYDALGQVTSGRKYWAGGTPVAGEQQVYSFDDIGNRETAAWGGDVSGANLRCENYNVNAGNQYTGRTKPGYVEVTGTANSDANVLAWVSSSSYARGLRQPQSPGSSYFWAELPVANSAGPVWLTVTNLAFPALGQLPEQCGAHDNGARYPGAICLRFGREPDQRRPVDVQLGRREPADRHDQPAQPAFRCLVQARLHV